VLSPDEYKRQRRERRKERTLQSESAVRAWASQHGLSLRVLNGGHHWLLERPGFVAEWWPSSAKLAINRDYLYTFHTPNWQGVVDVLGRFDGSRPGALPHQTTF
jgi:hypothetical protein